MKLDKMLIPPIKALLIVFLTHTAFAGDGKWIYDPEKGTSPANAALWSDPSNWTNGVIPSAKADRADLREATNRYIRIDTSLELYQLNGCAAGKPVLLGNGSVTLWGTAVNPNVVSANSRYFLPVSLMNSLANAWERFEGNELAADFTLLNNGFQNPYGSPIFHHDWYATSSDPVQTNGIVFAATGFHMNLHYSAYDFYGPASLSEDATSTWKLTKGSPFATPVGDTGHALPPGTAVSSGALFADGTYLKCIYPDGTIELSSAAGDDADAAEMTFAAFAPQVTYTVQGIGRSVTGWATINVNQARAEDSLRLVVKAFKSTGSTYPYRFSCASGWQPGTVVIEDGTRSGLWVGVCGARVEFAGTDGKGADAGLPNGTLTMGTSATDSTAISATAEIIVREGITAKVGTLTWILGKFVKVGGGTLVAGLDSVANNVRGTFVAKEGTLAFAEPDDGIRRSVATLAVSNGATLKLPAGGLKVTSKIVQQEGGAIIGPGILEVADGLDVSGLSVASDVLVLTSSQAAGVGADDYSWSVTYPAATSPLDEDLPVPANWMDASVASSLETQEDEKQLSLLKWKDVRGDGYPYAVPTGNGVYPEVVTNKSGGTHHVYIAHVETSDETKMHAMKYPTSIPGVRAVFKAFNGCGQFVGTSGEGTYMRTSGGYSVALFHNNGTGKPVPGTFYVNGVVRNQRLGFPYAAQNATDKSRFDPEVGEFHFADESLLPQITRIGNRPDTSNDRNGGDRICEMLVYTNALTFAQRQKICAYLMRKWMHGAEANVDYSAATAGRTVTEFACAGDVEMPVAEGRVSIVEKTSGTGTLVKTGEGTMYLADMTNAVGGLRVAGGTLKLNSRELTRADLPGDPYLHVDATEPTSFVYANEAKAQLSAWKDCRGDGHVSANLLTEGYYPTVVADGLNGLSVVDFGSGKYQRSNTSDLVGLIFPETDRLYAIFRVVGGNNGVIAGYIGPEKTSYDKGGELHTIPRTGGGYWASYAWTSDPLTSYALKACQNGTYSAGGSFFRVDGVEVNPNTTTSEPAGYKVVALDGYDHITSDALGCHYGSQGYYWGGGQPTGEAILYTNALSRSSTLKVEAYLNKKWFGKDTPGFRPAETGSLAVEAGATLDIVGGAPVSVSSLACAGRIAGGVTVRAGGEIDAVFGEGGTLVPFDITEGVDCSAGGTVVVSGDLRGLKGGDYPIAALAAGTSAGAWTVSFGEVTKIPNGEFTVGEADGKLVLRFVPPGLLLLVR